MMDKIYKLTIYADGDLIIKNLRDGSSSEWFEIFYFKFLDKRKIRGVLNDIRFLPIDISSERSDGDDPNDYVLEMRILLEQFVDKLKAVTSEQDFVEVGGNRFIELESLAIPEEEDFE